MEFASVVNAVSWAIAIQQHAEGLEQDRLRLRIGVNLGDVIADGEDIYGDGVNVAARLESWPRPVASSCPVRLSNSSMPS